MIKHGKNNFVCNSKAEVRFCLFSENYCKKLPLTIGHWHYELYCFKNSINFLSCLPYGWKPRGNTLMHLLMSTYKFHAVSTSKSIVVIKPPNLFLGIIFYSWTVSFHKRCNDKCNKFTYTCKSMFEISLYNTLFS